MKTNYKILEGGDGDFTEFGLEKYKVGDVIERGELDEIKDILRYAYDYNKESDFRNGFYPYIILTKEERNITPEEVVEKATEEDVNIANGNYDRKPGQVEVVERVDLSRPDEPVEQVESFETFDSFEEYVEKVEQVEPIRSKFGATVDYYVPDRNVDAEGEDYQERLKLERIADLEDIIANICKGAKITNFHSPGSDDEAKEISLMETVFGVDRVITSYGAEAMEADNHVYLITEAVRNSLRRFEEKEKKRQEQKEEDGSYEIKF